MGTCTQCGSNDRNRKTTVPRPSLGVKSEVYYQCKGCSHWFTAAEKAEYIRHIELDKAIKERQEEVGQAVACKPNAKADFCDTCGSKAQTRLYDVPRPRYGEKAKVYYQCKDCGHWYTKREMDKHKKKQA